MLLSRSGVATLDELCLADRLVSTSREVESTSGSAARRLVAWMEGVLALQPDKTIL